jgi:hypothetical protein
MSVISMADGGDCLLNAASLALRSRSGRRPGQLHVVRYQSQQKFLLGVARSFCRLTSQQVSLIARLVAQLASPSAYTAASRRRRSSVCARQLYTSHCFVTSAYARYTWCDSVCESHVIQTCCARTSSRLSALVTGDLFEPQKQHIGPKHSGA